MRETKLALPGDWVIGAPCGVNPDLWFSDSADDKAEARSICGTCPVQQTCRQWAIDNGEVFGIWGGVASSADRRTAPTSDPRCGTNAGYQAHRKRREYPCDPCRVAGVIARQRGAKKANRASSLAAAHAATKQAIEALQSDTNLSDRELEILNARAANPSSSLAEVAAGLGLTKHAFACRLKRAIAKAQKRVA